MSTVHFRNFKHQKIADILMHYTPPLFIGYFKKYHTVQCDCHTKFCANKTRVLIIRISVQDASLIE
jgi:hypothetical protein